MQLLNDHYERYLEIENSLWDSSVKKAKYESTNYNWESTYVYRW